CSRMLTSLLAASSAIASCVACGSDSAFGTAHSSLLLCRCVIVVSSLYLDAGANDAARRRNAHRARRRSLRTSAHERNRIAECVAENAIDDRLRLVGAEVAGAAEIANGRHVLAVRVAVQIAAARVRREVDAARRDDLSALHVRAQVIVAFVDV